MKAALLVSAALTAGCASTLSTEGERVRVVTEQQRQSCKFIRLVTVRKSLGPDKPGSALKEAMNETAAAGGNGLYIITSTVHWADGASVAGEAMTCPA